jgi:imidazolonepropionase-like amidohydrolase
MAYGTDLLGLMHHRQLTEFQLRSEVVPPLDLVRAATVNGARLLRRDGELGRVEPGYRADLIVVEGNPLEDIKVLADPQRPPRLVLKDGAIVANRL